jgi:hypothetical protein
MNDTDRRNALARLPAWAQREIGNLERQVAEQARHIAALSAGPADSDVLIHDYVHPDRLLGKGTAVTFLTGEPHGPDGRRDRITVEPSRERPGWLDVSLTSDRAAQAVYAYPVVSNRIRLGAGPY